MLQSTLDLYQLFAILRMGGWQAGCLNTDAQFNGSSTQPACTPQQVVQLQHYGSEIDFMATILLYMCIQLSIHIDIYLYYLDRYIYIIF